MKFIGSGWRLMVWLSITSVASAQLYWDTNGNTGGSGNAGGSWDSGTNWSTDAAGSSPTVGWTNGNTAIFSAGTDGTGTLSITAVGAVTTTGVTVQEGSVVLNSIAITNSGQTRLDATVGTLTLAGTTAITGTTYLRNNTASTTSILNIQDSAVISTSGVGGYIAFGDQANAAITINHSGGSVTNLGTINNPAGNNVSNRWGHWGGGTTNYNLSGGTLNLTGAPLYLSWDGAAILNISGGTANIQGFNMGYGTRTQSSTITVGGTGRLNVGSDGIVTGGTTNKTINLSGGTLGAFANWSTSRPINVTANSTINTLDSVDNTTGRTISLSGVLSGAGGLTKSGAGTLLLSSSNTFTGNTTISGGVLELSGTGKLYNAGYNNSAVITVDSTGTWRMPDYSYGGVGQLADYRQRRVLNGGTIEVTGNSHSSGQDFTVTSAGGTFRYTPAGQTLTLSGNGNTNINTSGNLTFDTGGNITLAGATAIIEGTGGLTKTGAGTLTLEGQHTYTGNTSITGGLVKLNTGQIYSNNGWSNRSISISGGAIVEIGGWADGDTVAQQAGFGQVSFGAGNLVVNNATIRYTGSQTNGAADRGFTIGAGGATLQAEGTNNFTLNQGRGFGVTSSAGGNLTLGGSKNGVWNMILGGTGGLVKADAGTWTVSNSNTYTGNTTISGGVLELSGTGKLYNAGFNNTAVITVDSTGTWRMPDYSYGGVGQLADYRQRRVLNGGTIEVTGNSHSSGQDFTVTAAGGTFRYTPVGQTLTLNGNGNTNIETSGNLTFDTGGNITLAGATAIIEGTGGLTKTGAGTLTLEGQHTYTGNTSITGGLVKLNTGQIYSNNGWSSRSISISGGAIVEIGGWADGDTVAQQAGFGQVSFAQGNIVMDNATIRYTGSQTNGNADRGFTIGAGGATLQAEGTNNFTLNQGRGFGVGSAAGGTLTLGGSKNGVWNMVLGGTGGLVKADSGRWTIANANTYTGPTTVNGGELRIDGSITSNVTINNGAILSGTGTITGAMAFGAGSVFAPGDSPGIINQVGNLTLNAGSTFLVDVWNPTSDQVNLTGELDINNATIETLWGGGADNIFRGGSPSANQLVWLVLNDGGDTIDGTFLNDGDTVNTGLLGLFGGGSPYLVSSGGRNYALFYNANHTGAGLGTISGGNDLLLIAIPEPSRALFLLLALVPFALRRTRVG